MVKGELITPAMLDARRSATRWPRKATSSTSATSRGVGSVKAILIDPRTGVLMGGVSPPAIATSWLGEDGMADG